MRYRERFVIKKWKKILRRKKERKRKNRYRYENDSIAMGDRERVKESLQKKIEEK